MKRVILPAAISESTAARGKPCATGGSPSRSEDESRYRGDEVAGLRKKAERDGHLEQNSAYSRQPTPTNPTIHLWWL